LPSRACGLPNAGKQRFLGISAQNPKLRSILYTLTPNLGVVRHYDDSFVVADIPGLIEGAADGMGLGHDFLRHIERVRLIVHLIDISGQEGRNPWEDYSVIRRELKKYSRKLAALPEIVVANKCDLLTDRENLKALRKRCRKKVFEISAATTQGVKNLMDYIAAELAKLPPAAPEVFEPFSYRRPIPMIIPSR
jgi:GTP-binding protein